MPKSILRLRIYVRPQTGCSIFQGVRELRPEDSDRNTVAEPPIVTNPYPGSHNLDNLLS